MDSRLRVMGAIESQSAKSSKNANMINVSTGDIRTLLSFAFIRVIRGLFSSLDYGALSVLVLGASEEDGWGSCFTCWSVGAAASA